MVDAALSEKKAVYDCYPLVSFPSFITSGMMLFYLENLQPKTPVTPREESGTSKTLFVGNLPFSVERADVYVLFFKKIIMLADFSYL